MRNKPNKGETLEVAIAREYVRTELIAMRCSKEVAADVLPRLLVNLESWERAAKRHWVEMPVDEWLEDVAAFAELFADTDTLLALRDRSDTAAMAARMAKALERLEVPEYVAVCQFNEDQPLTAS